MKDFKSLKLPKSFSDLCYLSLQFVLVLVKYFDVHFVRDPLSFIISPYKRKLPFEFSNDLPVLVENLSINVKNLK